MSAAAPIDVVLSSFRGAGRKMKPNNRGWLVSCPGSNHANGDRKPSLSVGVGEGGKVVMNCFAGCDKADLLAVVGLTFGDLDPEDSGSRSRSSRSSSPSGRPVSVGDALGLGAGGQVATDQLALPVESSGVVGGGILAAIAGRGSWSSAPPPVEAVEACTLPSCVRLRGSRLDCSAVYEYRDPDGVEVLGSVHRMVHAVGSDAGSREGFRPHTPDGRGGFRFGGSISGIYRHSELVAAARAATVEAPLVVVVCEGERDADAVGRCCIPGMVGVTNAGGAGVWKAHHTEMVAESVRTARGAGGSREAAHVVVVGDDDQAGRARVHSVVESLRSVNIPPAVAFPRLGKDLSDHFMHGGTLRDLREMSGVDLVAAAVVEVVEGPPVANPDRFLDKHDGLLVRTLALDITDGAPIMRDLSDTFWTYRGGVWTRDTKARVRAAVTARLGERTRRAHRTNVEEYLLGSVEIIEPATPQPDAINVHNGMLDWRTGRLRDHDPDDKSTVQLGAAWMPGATCPVVEAWLREVLPPDLLEPVGNSPGFIWEVLGYLCYSGNPLHKALLMLGAGRNGKGTFLRLVTALLGAANVSAVPLHSLVDNRFRVAELEGRLANIAGDLDSTWLESTALFKAITGGDSVTAERKYAAPFDFSPFAVPVYSANAVWGTPDTSAGYMSRWVVIPFPNSFDGVEDRGLDAALSAPAELEGVLAKAVQGLRAVLAAGNFTEPPSVAEAFGRFRDESDPVSAFMRETTEIAGGWFIPRGRIWDIYLAWVSDSGAKSKLARSKLYARLVGAGWVATAQDGVRGFTGRRLVVEVVPDVFGAGHLEPVAAALNLGAQV
jgi:P4 family phage/plasmid primase-like protien